jgi:hypothetical protein
MLTGTEIFPGIVIYDNVSKVENSRRIAIVGFAQ